MNYNKKDMLRKCKTIKSYIEDQSDSTRKHNETNEHQEGHPRKIDILPKNEFLRQHSDYIEQAQKDSIYFGRNKDHIGYPRDMRIISGQAWYSYVEAYKYDCYGLLKWKNLRNKEYQNKPYPARNFEHNGTLEQYCKSDNPFK